jgi:hypothetical protein
MEITMLQSEKNGQMNELEVLFSEWLRKVIGVSG